MNKNNELESACSVASFENPGTDYSFYILCNIKDESAEIAKRSADILSSGLSSFFHSNPPILDELFSENYEVIKTADLATYASILETASLLEDIFTCEYYKSNMNLAVIIFNGMNMWYTKLGDATFIFDCGDIAPSEYIRQYSKNSDHGFIDLDDSIKEIHIVNDYNLIKAVVREEPEAKDFESILIRFVKENTDSNE